MGAGSSVPGPDVNWEHESYVAEASAQFWMGVFFGTFLFLLIVLIVHFCKVCDCPCSDVSFSWHDACTEGVLDECGCTGGTGDIDPASVAAVNHDAESVDG